jgi:hypothetical protein
MSFRKHSICCENNFQDFFDETGKKWSGGQGPARPPAFYSVTLASFYVQQRAPYANSVVPSLSTEVAKFVFWHKMMEQSLAKQF